MQELLSKMWRQILYVVGAALSVAALAGTGHVVAAAVVAIAFAVIFVAAQPVEKYLKLREERERKAKHDTRIVEGVVKTVSHVETFTTDDFRKWVDEYPSDGKALIAKMNNDVLDMAVREFGELGLTVDFDADKYFNTLLLVMKDSSGKVIAQRRVKYKSLAPLLENMLTKGNGYYIVQD